MDVKNSDYFNFKGSIFRNLRHQITSIMKFLLLVFSIFLISSTHSQESDSLSTILQDISLRQKNMSKLGMISLNSWAVGNIAYGSIASAQTTGEAKYFHQMNMIWNFVNLGIGVPGLISAYGAKNEDTKLPSLFKMQNKMEKIYLFNAGLDLGYIAGGVALRQYGLRDAIPDGEKWRGYGSALIFQGGYLFLHDLAMFYILKSNQPLLNKSWEHLSVKSNGMNLKIEFK